jgi:uncharacterized Zn finger protein
MTNAAELTVSAKKETVEGSCPECGGQELARYPVVSEKGWEMVTKCQSCLYSLEREKWHRLGHIHLLVDSVS